MIMVLRLSLILVSNVFVLTCIPCTHVSIDERLNVIVKLILEDNEHIDMKGFIDNLSVNLNLSYLDGDSHNSDRRNSKSQSQYSIIPPPTLSPTPTPTPTGNDTQLNSQAFSISNTLIENEEAETLFEEDEWVSLYRFSVDIIRIRMNIVKPLAALTATVTYKDKPENQIINTNDGNDNDDDDDILEGWNSINLLEDLSPSLNFPSNRLPQSYQHNELSSNSLPNAKESKVTLKRSHRIIIPISSALNIRMRAVNIPFLLSDNDNNTPHLVLGLELENTTSSLFEIYDVNIRMKEVYLGEDNNELIAERFSNEPMETIEMNPKDQHNLIYVVKFPNKQQFNQSKNDINKFRKYNVRIGVTAKADGKSDKFDMKWNSLIEVSNKLINDFKQPSQMITNDSILSSTRPISMTTNNGSRISGPVAGNRRYTLTSIQQANKANEYNQNVRESEDNDSDSSDSSNSNNNNKSSNENILLSVSILKPTRTITSSKIDSRSPSIFSPRENADIIKRFDVFPVEIFIFNKSTLSRRFILAFPNHSNRIVHMRNQSLNKQLDVDEYLPCGGIIPLENFVRVGPLSPGSCQSLNLNFLALDEGVHTLDLLELFEPDTGFSSKLTNVFTIVIN